MRCRSCDCNLSDAESVRKSPNTGEYLDMCSHCLNDIDLYEEDDMYEDEIEEEESE